MKKIAFIFVFILICPFFIFGCSGEKVGLNSYEIFVDYDDVSHSAECFENVKYVNMSNNALQKVCFHLYPNAFRENAKKEVVSLANKGKAYPNGESFGEIAIQSVKIMDAEVEFQIVGSDENILEIPLFEKLYPDERVSICIDFALILPNINHRFGYGDSAVNFGNFYPIACVFDDLNGFKTDIYTANGDPFNSDVSDYDVKVKYDKDLVLASSGEQSESLISGEKKVTSISAKKVRDFCFVLSDKFNVIEEDVNGVGVNYFYYDDPSPKDSLKTAICSLLTFNEMFGKYPYKTLSVVQTNFLYGGMEYPNLVMISDDVKEKLDYQYVIVHEIAHQWWYGVVGNDEFNEPWVDESLTEYSTALFFEKNAEYGLDYGKIIENANEEYKFFVKVYSNIYDNFDTSMQRSLNEFKTEPEYVNLIYTKGVLMYDTIRSSVGEKNFLNALKIYYKNFAFKIARGDDLVNCFESECGRKLRGLFESYLTGKVVIV